MKIYGQRPQEIFSSLPWQYKIVVAVGAVFILFVIVYVPGQMFTLLAAKPRPAATTGPEPLQVAALAAPPPTGIFDPSLAADPQTGTAWLAYAALTPAQSGGDPLVHVRVAAAQDKDCAHWAEAGGGFDSKTDDLLAPDEKTVFRSGVWRIETPSLVYDPDDHGREWKLYAYKYFWPKDHPDSALQIAHHYGVIVYKTSTDPAKGWSAEQWLFSPMADYPPPPYEQMILLHLNGLNPALQNIVTYSRPSAIYKDGALVLTLSAFTNGTTPEKIIMIVSRDHGNSWKYVGAPLSAADLAVLGPYTKLDGATLVEQGGQVYLAAVLGDAQQHESGTFIFSFDDFSKGLLHRDSKTGAPVLLRQIPLTKGATGGGFATYSDACPFGLLTGERSPGFRIFKTLQSPAQK